MTELFFSDLFIFVGLLWLSNNNAQAFILQDKVASLIR